MNPKQMLLQELQTIRNETGIDAPFTDTQRKEICGIAYRIAQSDRSEWIASSEQEARRLATCWSWYAQRCESETNNLLNAVLKAQIVKLYEVSATLETISTQYDKQAEAIERVITDLMQSQRVDYYG